MRQPIVLDTNVLISALISRHGPAREVLRRCLQHQYQPLVGNALFAEYEEVAGRPDILARCPVPQAQVRTLLNAFYSVGRWVNVYYLWHPNLRDEADNHVLELAIAGGAQWLVTHNIRDFERTQLHFDALRILTPERLLAEASHGHVNH
jgi:putative PIN family toxin of toxin-antitoxin system